MTDPRMMSREQCVLRYALDLHVAAQPDKVFAIFDGDEQWTYRDLGARVRRAAAGLRDLGVAQGDFVASWLPNGPDIVVAWFAINYIGAVYVPVNIHYRGALLKHALDLSGATLAIVHGDLVERLADLEFDSLKRAIVIGGTPVPVSPFALLEATVLAPDTIGDLSLAQPIEPWDVQSIIFTSGTTGPSKGVLSSYLHLASMALSASEMQPDDRQLITLPMFHAGGTAALFRAVLTGTSAVIPASFRTQDFWPVVERYDVTTVVLLGVMSGFLIADAGDRQPKHKLRNVTVLPLDQSAIEFGRRFACTTRTTFNMTETSMPILSEDNPTALGSAGKPRAGVEARIVDANDCEVPDGGIGELILRCDTPWAMTHGYYRNPEATAASWRNGWFHTGDRFRKDEDGNYFFVDRAKDAIRRRGENISSFEVEAELGAHPAVREAAVVAVQSELSEDEVLAAVALVEGAAFDPVELIDFLRPRMAHFMIPRYIRVIDELPKTPTMKVQKHILRDAGITEDTWDRVAANVEVKGVRLG
jgi:crotonobetaine/carnitine-CoA ligase